MTTALGALLLQPATTRPDLLAPPVLAAVNVLSAAGRSLSVAEIDPGLADTAAFCAEYRVPLEQSANCVVLAGKREGVTRYAAAVVLATTRADVNGVIRRWMNVRKISFAPMADAVELSGMEFGGITPIGLPVEWPVLLDERVLRAGLVVIGSGLRRSKLVIEGMDLGRSAGVTVIPDLAVPVPVSVTGVDVE